MTPATLRNRILAKYPNSSRQLDRVPDHLLTEFRQSLDQGTDPVWAEMAVCRTGPNLKTETAYATKRRFGTLLDQFDGDDQLMQQYAAGWRKKGVNVTGNEVWLSNLAKSPDDVEALAHPGEVQSTMKRLAERNNVSLEGAVKHTARQVEPKKDKPLGYDIVTRIAKEEAKKDPSFLESEKKKQAKYEEIVDKHSFKPR